MCGKCHKCGRPVRIVLDGEEWCARCQRYQRPRMHGWRDPAPDRYDLAPCNEAPLEPDVVIIPESRPATYPAPNIDPVLAEWIFR